MTVGKRIFFDNATGGVILEVQAQNGTLPSVERNIEQFTLLSERNRDTFDAVELEYEQFKQDFEECNGYKVDITAVPPTIVFSYPDPNVPPTPPVYQAPLTAQVNDLKSTQADILFAMVDKNLM